MKLLVRYQIILLVFLVLALYYPALFADINTIDDERMITGLLNMDTFTYKGLFFPGGGFYYRPVLMLTFYFDKYVWGLHETFMHLENTILHAINTILVFGITWNIKKKWYASAPLVMPFITAVFFAVHPIATESVNWISGRTDLLSGTFLFLAFYLLLLGTLRASYTVLFVATVSFLLACLSKDSAIAAFPAYLILTYTATKDSDMLRLRRFAYLCFSGSMLSYFIMRKIATGGNDTGIGGVATSVSFGDFDLFNKLRIVIKVLGFYAKKLFVPWPLNFAIIHVSDWYFVVGIIVLIASVLFLFRNNIISALFLLAVSTVVPALLVPLGQLTWTPMAERYIYMSTAPFCIAVSFIVYSKWKQFNDSRFLLWFSIAVVALFTFSTAQRTLIWQKNITFFEDAVQKTPDFAPLKNELALTLERTGRKEEATRIYQSNIMPNSAKYSIVTDLNRARASMSQGKPAEARDILLAKKYDKSKPLYVDYLEMLIAIDEKILLQPGYKERGLIEQEVRVALLSLAEVSGDPLHYYRIGKNFLAIGMTAEAATYFKLAYEKSSDNAFYKAAAKRLAEKYSSKNVQ